MPYTIVGISPGIKIANPAISKNTGAVSYSVKAIQTIPAILTAPPITAINHRGRRAILLFPPVSSRIGFIPRRTAGTKDDNDAMPIPINNDQR